MATIDTSQNFFPPFHENVRKALEELLSKKHLYQSVRIDDDYVEPVTLRFPVAGPSTKIAIQRETLRKIGASLFDSCDWEPTTYAPSYLFGLGNSFDNARIPIHLPTIITECHCCKERWPFNPIESGTAAQTQDKQNGDQWLLFSYECQACKKEPIRFLVRRQKQKLTLCGRDPMEPISVPDEIPKIHKVRFGNAIIAYQSGQTLAAIFGLRVFIEQHWRSNEAVSDAIAGISKPTGDEMGAAYKTTLPAEFKEKFPTLCECYDELSEAMHLANESSEVYERVHDLIVLHFRALQIFQESSLARIGTKA